MASDDVEWDQPCPVCAIYEELAACRQQIASLPKIRTGEVAQLGMNVFATDTNGIIQEWKIRAIHWGGKDRSNYAVLLLNAWPCHEITKEFGECCSSRAALESALAAAGGDA